MAVQILNDLPDVAVHRGEPLAPLQALAPLRPSRTVSSLSGRAWFATGTVVLHVLAIAGFLAAQQIRPVIAEPEPMVVSLIEAPTPAERSRDVVAAPRPTHLTFMLSPPQDVAYETDS